MSLHETPRIAVLAGDGIGPEVMRETVRVLSRLLEIYGRRVEFQEGLVGGAAYAQYGVHLPRETVELCRNSDAILFGAVGGPIAESHLPQWQGCERNSILALRKEFCFSANLRPAHVYSELPGSCPLREDIIAGGVDLLIVRELQGDVYFGEHTAWSSNGKRFARDVGEYSEDQIVAVARVAFDAARTRSQRVISVDKANVLTTSKLWREVVHEVHRDYPDVSLEDMLVDNAALQLVKDPGRFDVLLTSNLFGDILSDLAAALPGSLGLTPSASLTTNRFGLYEPSGGSAPDIAGNGIANPIAQILSAALLLRYSLGWAIEARALELAVHAALSAGYRSSDIYTGQGILVSTADFATAIMGCISDPGTTTTVRMS
jgi:3-isopropylmalate dehydrogenase